MLAGTHERPNPTSVTGDKWPDDQLERGPNTHLNA